MQGGQCNIISHYSCGLSDRVLHKFCNDDGIVLHWKCGGTCIGCNHFVLKFIFELYDLGNKECYWGTLENDINIERCIQVLGNLVGCIFGRLIIKQLCLSEPFTQSHGTRVTGWCKSDQSSWVTSQLRIPVFAEDTRGNCCIQMCLSTILSFIIFVALQHFIRSTSFVDKCTAGTRMF
jgi:hypothetical protein